MKPEKLLDYLLPAIVGIAALAFWEWAVAAFEVQSFVLPPPSAIWATLWTEWPSLGASALVTLRVTVEAFVIALILGVGLAIVFAQSRLVERAFLPYAIIIQVTPIVAIAPLINIWVGLDNADLAVLVLAIIVAFFPILANTTLGLRSADRQLQELFALYGASPLQRLLWLQLPSALPYVLAGMKISGGLALIGAVVAEFAAGSGTSTGLAWRIIEAGNRLQVAKMFAALALLSLMGIAIYAALSALEYQLLRRWHESVRPKE